MSKTKNDLKSRFKTGMRPTEKDFEDLIESMITGEDDKIYSKGDKVGIGIKEPKEKLEVDGAVKVGESTANPTEGTIRFNTNKEFQGFDGSNWVKFGGENSAWKSESDTYITPSTNYSIEGASIVLSFEGSVKTGYTAVNGTRLSGPSGELYILAKKIMMGSHPSLVEITIDNGTVDIPNLSSGGGSDIRLKDNIRPYEGGLEAVVQMKPCKFSYNGKLGIKEGLEKIGLIAQDLETAAPELVYVNSAKATDEIPDPMYIKSDEIIYLAINAIKELNQKVVALEAEIKTLKGGGA
jgi:hypothetical protein